MKSKSDKKAGVLDPATSKTENDVAVVKAESHQQTKLSDKEKDLLKECETDIREHQQAFFVVGYRLWQIREEKLYRAKYKTFESYCTKEFDFSKTHANRLVQAHLCEKHLKTMKDVDLCIPTKESQVRMIADLEPEEWVEVAAKVKETVGDHSPTAGDFGDAREALFPKPKPEAKPSKATAVKTVEKVVQIAFDTNLVSFSDISKRVKHLYNICADSSRKQEVLKLIGNLQRDIDGWAIWEKDNRHEEAA